MKMKTIVVNGASSAGCTSFVREFSAQMGDRYLSVHIDEFTYTLPDGMWNRCSNTDEGWAEIGVAFNDHLASLARNGTMVIADAFYKLRRPIDHLFKLLGRENLFFVQLYCDLPELERREVARGNRRIGLARSQFEQLYSFQNYNLKIDSTTLDVEGCVDKLLGACAI